MSYVNGCNDAKGSKTFPPLFSEKRDKNFGSAFQNSPFFYELKEKGYNYFSNNIKYIYNNNIDLTLFIFQNATSSTKELLFKLNFSETRITNIENCILNGYSKHEIMLLPEKNILKLIPFMCNSRLCQNCRKLKIRQNRIKLKDSLKDFKTYYFRTTSYKNIKFLTKEYLKQISVQEQRFNEYLRRKNFRIDHFVSVLEIKYNVESKTWNIHIHGVYDSEYININILRSTLEKVTKGVSHHVFIKKIYRQNLRSQYHALNYITKYLGKGCEQDLPIALQVEYYKETKGIRFLRTYKVKRKKLEKKGYIKLSSYIFENSDYEFIECLELVQDYLLKMYKYEINTYDLDLSDEENFFKYANQEKQLSVMGV